MEERIKTEITENREQRASFDNYFVLSTMPSVTLLLNPSDKVKAVQSFLWNCNVIFMKKKNLWLNIWELFS